MFRLAVAAFVVVLVTADPVPSSRWAPGINPFTPQGRIVGGNPVDIEDYPYQVSLREHRGLFICGGSIISENFILTAGKCVSFPYQLPITVRVGSTQEHRGGTLHEVSKIIRHPEYSINKYGMPVNDIAVIKVKTPIEFTKSVQPVPLFNENEESVDGSLSTISGWGMLAEGGPLPESLYAVDLPIVSKNACSEAYRSYGGLPQGQICAAYPQGSKGSCNGDGGGPLVINGRQAGIASWGHGCATADYPEVYTEVASYRDFITKFAAV